MDLELARPPDFLWTLSPVPYHQAVFVRALGGRGGGSKQETLLDNYDLIYISAFLTAVQPR